MTANGFDYDWLVVGSGFGGGISVLRLAEKGYRVGVLESRSVPAFRRPPPRARDRTGSYRDSVHGF